MSANVESCFYYGQVPWHGLGVKLDNPATSEEAIKAAGMDWEVKCGAVSVTEFDGETTRKIVVPDYFCTVRMDKRVPLGIVGRLYTPIQNKEAFNFFDAIVGDKKATYHTAGVLGKGETVWMLAKLPDDIRIVGTDDIINKYLLLTNKHDGTMSLRMFFTPVRVVCQNTLSAALSSRKHEGVVLRHFPDIHQKVEQARKILGLTMTFYKNLSEAFNALARVEVSEDWLNEYYGEVIPTPEGETASTRLVNIREGMEECFESLSNSLPGVRGTAWAAYNSVTEWVDHKRAIPKMAVDKTRRLESIWIGSGAVMKERALNIALERIGAEKLVTIGI